MPRIVDLTGQRFVHWLVLKADNSNRKPGDTGQHYLCRCDCGKEKTVRGTCLRTGRTSSCGCLTRKRGGVSRTPSFRSWKNMKLRCQDPSNHNYPNYGARGISVCQKWQEYSGFLEDMGERPPGMSLERIDNNGNYCLENCRWATLKEQNRNKRNNRNVEILGTTKTIAEWAEIFNIKSGTIYDRLNKSGWSEIKAITTPVRPRVNKQS